VYQTEKTESHLSMYRHAGFANPLPSAFRV